MSVDLAFLSSDLAISGIFAFIIGIATVKVYTKIKSIFEERRYRTENAIVEAIVLEYSRRLQDYNKAIVELRTKLDIVEARIQPHQIVSQQPSQLQPHVAPASGHVTLTQHETIMREGNGTTDYILKLLLERPRTSREVQQAIGRTREHTSRLMKKLHDSGLVSRDIDTKPFRYNITGAGRETLKKRSETESIVV